MGPNGWDFLSLLISPFWETEKLLLFQNVGSNVSIQLRDPSINVSVKIFLSAVWTRSIWKMLGPFATASRRTPPVLHFHSPGVATVARRLRIDVHNNIDNNDNAWQRGPLWPHGMGPIKVLSQRDTARDGTGYCTACDLVWKRRRMAPYHAVPWRAVDSTWKYLWTQADRVTLWEAVAVLSATAAFCSASSCRAVYKRLDCGMRYFVSHTCVHAPSIYIATNELSWTSAEHPVTFSP